LRYLVFLTTVCISATALEADLLIGLSWSSPQQLERIASAARRVRYVTSQTVFLSGDESDLRRLETRGFIPFFVEEYGPEDAYFIIPRGHYPSGSDIAPSYRDPSGWALVRLKPTDEEYRLPHFLYPLPETYSIKGWLAPRLRTKPVSPLGSSSMTELLAQVDARRLQRDIQTLALKDWDGPSTRENLRTRFTVHPETFESTEYLRRQLAAVLGEEAVEIQAFAVDEDRLSSHLRGRVGDEPVDAVAHNVVGVLAGTDPGAGYYVICGHYDATGVRTPGWNWRTDPAPGADDNATGAALVLESARVLAGQQFPWSIRFIAFSGEELGLLGSRDYATAAAAAGDLILGVLNFDMFGYNDLIDRVELATNPASRWLAELMVEVSERYDIGLRVDMFEDQAAQLSDHAPFWARGYDAILAIENYLPTDSTHYAVRDGLYRINTQYHTTADVPDSLNWNLVRKTAQLAVAALAQYALETGLPNLAVFTGDLQPDEQGNLRVHIGNIGSGLLDAPFRVRVSRCGADSAACEPIYDAEHDAELAPGQAGTVTIPWQRLGEMVFLLEVDPDDRIAETSEEDNRLFQQVYLQPRDRIVVYPNPYSPDEGGLLVFAGIPLKARVRIFSMNGGLVWTAQEDDSGQRRLGARIGEIRWNGVNQSGLLVNSGIYIYALTAPDGKFLHRDKIAVIR